MRGESIDDGGSRGATLVALRTWSERGWIRRLDAALARFVAELCPTADGVVLLATALVAHLEGQGHTCLVLDALLREPGHGLPWDGEAQVALGLLLDRLPREVDAWTAILARCDAVGSGRDVAESGTPLVLSGSRLYLRRYWRHERRVADAVSRRVGRFAAVDEASARHWLDRLFPSTGTGADGPNWQRIACAIALRGRLAIVTGGPGTGKTYTAARVIALLKLTSPSPERLRIALAAPTGKAAARLRQSIDAALATLQSSVADGPALAERIGPAQTLHALLGTRRDSRRFRHDASNPLDVDVVIVDEASMVHVEMMDALLDALPDHARVLLLGDKDQLASVEAGAVLGELCRDADAAPATPSTARYVEAVTRQTLPREAIDATGRALEQQIVTLRRGQRFGGAIDRLAQAVNAGDAGRAAELLDAPTADDANHVVAWRSPAVPGVVVDLAEHGRAGAPGGYRRYLDAIGRRPAAATADGETAWIRDVLSAFDTFRVLCAVRGGDWGVERLNRAIADRFVDAGHLVAGGEWYEGRPVLVTRNDYGLGVFNGDIGIALRVAPDSAHLRVWFADGVDVRSVGVARLGHVETAFAMTVHKSQGSEFDHTVLVLPADDSMVGTRELVYTGITRARHAFTLVSARRESLAVAVVRKTRRSSGLLGFVRGAEAPGSTVQ